MPAGEGRPVGRAPPSRDKEGTHPGRFLCVWNVETPPGPRRVWWGKPTVRKANSFWREQDAQEANAGGRKATGNHGRYGHTSKWPPMDNWPDTGPVGRTEKVADVGR